MCNGFLIFFMSIISFQSFSQKLPDIQGKGVLALLNTKVDGKDLEWNDEFKAYNKATEVFYTVTNNKDYVYLVIKAENPDVIKKIILNGITFTLFTSYYKNERNGYSFLFPKYDTRNQMLFLDVNKNSLKTDSLLNVYNGRVTAKLKQIEINNLKTEFKETLSIYNEEQIKAASLFDKNLNFVYDLGIPIKYLEGATSFKYNLKINSAGNGREIKFIESANGTVLSYQGADGINYNLGYSTPSNLALSFSTDFTGFYKLTSK